MNEWAIYINGRLMRADEALPTILQTKLGGKSTASIFLLALHYLLGSGRTADLRVLLNLYLESPNVLEFSRKICFRLLSADVTDRSREQADKLFFILLDIIGYSNSLNTAISSSPKAKDGDTDVKMTEAADKETTTPDEQRRPQHREHRVETGVDEIKNPTLLALRILLAVVLATVDVRQQILKKHGFVLSYLFTLGADQSQPAEVHEYVAKCLDSLFLVADPEDFRIFFPPLSQLLSHTGEDGSQTFLDAVLNLIRVDNDAVLEYTIRLLSYVYEYADAEVVTILDEYPIFDEIAKLLNAGPMNLQMFLQQFMSHLTLRIPTRLHQTFRELFLKYMDAPNLVTVNFCSRSLHLLDSLGTRIGVGILFRENVDGRRQKQITMRRSCEGCERVEQNFGDFMMCAGCRKVRYCSKECQVKDWKYHRMRCNFFRPRPGFRSRGIQTPTDNWSQTDDPLQPSEYAPIQQSVANSGYVSPASSSTPDIRNRYRAPIMRQQQSLASLDGGITAPVTAPSPAAVVLNDSMDVEQSSVHNSTTVNETVDEEEQAPSGSETPSKREIGVCTIISYALNADWRFRSEQDAETQTQ